jgi:arylsulfatase A-like enzyme
MTDDQGWGDVGYNGHPHLQTPNLDEMAASGVRFDRFYAAAPVCSPTRGSCLTGRHPFRFGVTFANTGHLPEHEFSLATYLRDRGYRTGHFGKWHLGSMTQTMKDSNRGGPRFAAHFAPPWLRGFEVCFSTESKVPTYNSMLTPAAFAKGVDDKEPGSPYGANFWTADGNPVPAKQSVNDPNGVDFSGDTSELVMDHALQFVQASVEQQQPFFSVIWFHAPHHPVVAGDKHKDLYRQTGEQFDEWQLNYFGALSSVDEQVGRLRAELRRLEVADDTILLFCSDNGPEGVAGKAPGTAGEFRGRKRNLYEGGLRVPGLMEWPRRFPKAQVVSAAASTLDYVPTILAALDEAGQLDEAGELDETAWTMDGINLLPILDGDQSTRNQPLGFESVKQVAWVEDRWKLYANKVKRDSGRYQLYDLENDPGERHDVAASNEKVVARMKRDLRKWRNEVNLDMREHDPRPNIILIMADDLGKEWLSCYGGEEMQTPNLDQLASDGIRFENAYSMPVCTPTRTTLLTGQYPFRHGWVNHWDVPRWGKGCHFDPNENYSFARVLRDAGYATAIAGKWQINDFRLQPTVLRRHGFDDWCVWTGYEDGNPPSDKRYWDPYLHTRDGSSTHQGKFGADVFRDFALDFIYRFRDRPHFVYLPMCLPHSPMVTTPDHLDADGKTQKYQAMVEYVDSFVGDLRGGINELGLERETIIVFTTDNGSTRGIKARRDGRLVQGGKNQLSQSGCNVPFLVYAPGFPVHDKVSHELIDFTDLFPTLTDLAGSKKPPQLKLDGQSFAGVIRGEAEFVGREWLMAMGGSPAEFREGRVHSAVAFANRVVRNRDYKLWIEDGAATRLFHLPSDPDEQKNLIQSTDPEHSAARQSLQAVVDAMPKTDASPRYQVLAGN